jgi:hypothetical protein
MTMAERPSDRLDDTVADSFPASDPPSHTPSTRAGDAAGRHDADAGPAGEAAPKGTPSHDRHASETAAARIDGHHPAERHDP